MILPWILLLAPSVSCLPQDSIVSSCEAFGSRLRLENTTILSTTHISVPTKIGSDDICDDYLTVVSPHFCRVKFVINTTSTSIVRAEAWLPDTWYGRYLTVGNGGLEGCIDYRNLNYGTSMHFATIGSNNGHDGLDGRSFLHNPEVINDFAFRAVHVQTIIGKQIVEAYYGHPHHKSYYLGCSTAGRQGTLVELKYPDDFDGIVAGAPATDWNHLVGVGGMLARYIGAPNAATSKSFITPALWDIIAAEILQQCDELDGVKDGIITEPDACDFLPEALLCDPDLENSSDCLSPAQVRALKKIYEPLYGTTGELLFPRYDPGTEADGNALLFMSGDVSMYTKGWYKYAIFNDSNYDFSNFSVQDIEFANRINPGGISTFDGDFSRFRDRGGKFLTYHGRRDELIPSGNSKRLYDLISRTLGMPSLDTFYRLFLVPGMNHCHRGPGAGNFGQLGVSTNVKNVSTHNVLLAMVDWVEGAVAPDYLVGTGDDGRERVHCLYPQKSVWDGHSFVCRTDDFSFQVVGKS